MRIFLRGISILLGLSSITITVGVSVMQFGESYNFIHPYVDTEFAEGYTPQKFDQITIGMDKEEVKMHIGNPLYIRTDTADGGVIT
ncbi:MAG TPA: hypothetical protein VF691_01260 [Cytophagaceae bacterium]|jgi:outer membrane protein assembly factor BamE (lipoprotein component of BamABCDE complex)